ncbi:MAG: exodeoxyribonuclease VII small subunit [Prevotella sp.]
MAKENIRYEEAVSRLEEIADKMESGKMDIDTLCAELKTAQKLIKMCRDKLTRTDVEIKKILDDK